MPSFNPGLCISTENASRVSGAAALGFGVVGRGGGGRGHDNKQKPAASASEVELDKV